MPRFVGHGSSSPSVLNFQIEVFHLYLNIGGTELRVDPRLPPVARLCPLLGKLAGPATLWCSTSWIAQGQWHRRSDSGRRRAVALPAAYSPSGSLLKVVH